MSTQKTNRRSVVVFVILIAVTAWVYTPSVFACPCPEKPDPLTALKQSVAVFSGQVLNIDEEGDLSPKTGTRMRKVAFSVDRAWKGIERIVIKIHTEKDSVACGYAFATGNTYLVYAHGEKGNLQVSLCSRTQKLGDVRSEEMAVLGKPIFLPEDEDFPLFILISDFPKTSVFVFATLTGLVTLYFLRKFKGL